MERELATHMMACATAFAAKRGFELSTLGRMAAGDSRFFKGLDDTESTFTVRKYDSVIRWFAENWPEGTRWPRGVPRPTPGPGVEPGIGAPA